MGRHELWSHSCVLVRSVRRGLRFMLLRVAGQVMLSTLPRGDAIDGHGLEGARPIIQVLVLRPPVWSSSKSGWKCSRFHLGADVTIHVLRQVEAASTGAKSSHRTAGSVVART